MLKIEVMNEEETKIYLNLTSDVIRIRGSFINDICHLEKLIDETISRYFCDTNEKRLQLLEIVLGNEKINFSNKVTTLKVLFDKHKPIPTIINENPNMFKDIVSLIELRNILAHYMLDTSNAGLARAKKGTIGFMKYKHTTTLISYTFDELKARVDEISKYVGVFRNFLSTWNVLPKSPDTPQNPDFQEP